MAAIENVVQSGEAHITSGIPPQSLIIFSEVSFPISAHKDGLKDSSQSTVYTSCPLCANAFAIDFVPQNKSNILIYITLLSLTVF